MQQIIEQLQAIIEKYKPILEEIDPADFSAKPILSKWSKKEILGHLIDSAQTNIRRFVMGQYEEQPYLVYEQNQWVRISNYQNYPDKDLIDLWYLLNKHICVVLSNTSPDNTRRLVKTSELHSIEWLASDYNSHLLHHLVHLTQS